MNIIRIEDIDELIVSWSKFAKEQPLVVGFNQAGRLAFQLFNRQGRRVVGEGRLYILSCKRQVLADRFDNLLLFGIARFCREVIKASTSTGKNTVHVA
ncbi:hypothetical protein D3C77_561630 [compost metagenome]